MRTTLHWHGYGPWTGSGQELRDGEGKGLRNPGRDPGDPATPTFLASTMPPMQLGHYLLRKTATSRPRTWTDIDQAMQWMADLYDKHPPVYLPDEGYSDCGLEARLLHSRTGLIHGSDAYWSYYLRNFNKVAYGVICCPHSHLRDIPCPLPPS